jgi:hypothetical protein
MNLRSTLVLNVPTNNAAASEAFFSELNFEKTNSTLGLLLTDGKISICHDEKSLYKLGLLLPSDNLNELVSDFKSRNLAFEMRFENEEISAVSVTEPNTFSLTYLPAALFKTVPKTTEKPLSLCGSLYEISLKTKHFSETITFWENLGFKITMGKKEEEKFVTLTCDTITLGIYNPDVCPHFFNNPALTYFELNSAEIIKNLKSKGIAFRQEIPNKEGSVEEAILESPDGVHIFLFKGWE